MIPLILIGTAYLIGKSMEGNKKFAKGGKVTTNDADFAKFKKVGIDDKYTIEAIKDVGLGKFDKESILSDIKTKYEALLKGYKDYVLSEDSEALTNAIKADIEVRTRGGDSLANIKEAESWLTDKDKRKQYMQQIIDAQTATITEWVSYLKQSDYSIPFKYLILKAVLGYYYDYKLNKLIEKTPITTRNFTPFDAGSLADLYASNSNYLLQDYTQIQVANALKILESKEKIKETSGGVWIKFNGGSKTSKKEIAENARQLSQMVQNTFWCTKTNAYSQLQGGDFYVFVTKKGDEVFPRIAVRMEGDRVGELRGNNSARQDLEENMLPVAKDFLLNNIPNDSGKKWLDSIEYNDKVIAFKTKLTNEPLTEAMYMEFLNLKSNEKKYLLDYADRNGNVERIEIMINEKINKNDLNELSKSDFSDGLSNYTSKTKHIIGSANFRDSQVENLGNLTTIGGDALFSESQVKNLGNLSTIGGRARFRNSQIENLGKLITIGGYADFIGSQVKDLGNLTTIGGYADFGFSEIKYLGNLTTIGNNAYFGNSQVENLGNLTTIGGDALFQNSQVENLGKLITIGEDAYFEGSKVKNLRNLTTIGGDAAFENSQVEDLGKLTTIGGYADFASKPELKAEWEKRQQQLKNKA